MVDGAGWICLITSYFINREFLTAGLSDDRDALRHSLDSFGAWIQVTWCAGWLLQINGVCGCQGREEEILLSEHASCRSLSSELKDSFCYIFEMCACLNNNS